MGFFLVCVAECVGGSFIYFPSSGGTVSTGGVSMGQIITAPPGDEPLNSFKFYGIGLADPPANTKFNISVYEFDPVAMNRMGLPLFDSGILELNSTSKIPFEFDTGGIDITAGKKYLFELNQEGYGNSAKLALSYSNSTYEGAQALKHLTTNQWVPMGGVPNLAFQAVFGTVPEPSTIALLLTVAFGGLLWWRRRR
jgi:hypothetical protein